MDLWGMLFGERTVFDVVTDFGEPVVWIGLLLLVVVVLVWQRKRVAEVLGWVKRWSARNRPVPISRVHALEEQLRKLNNDHAVEVRAIAKSRERERSEREAAEAKLAAIETRRADLTRPRAEWGVHEEKSLRRFVIINQGDSPAFDVEVHLPSGAVQQTQSSRVGNIPNGHSYELGGFVADRMHSRVVPTFAQIRWRDADGDVREDSVRVRYQNV